MGDSAGDHPFSRMLLCKVPPSFGLFWRAWRIRARPYRLDPQRTANRDLSQHACHISKGFHACRSYWGYLLLTSTNAILVRIAGKALFCAFQILEDRLKSNMLGPSWFWPCRRMLRIQSQEQPVLALQKVCPFAGLKMEGRRCNANLVHDLVVDSTQHLDN